MNHLRFFGALFAIIWFGQEFAFSLAAQERGVQKNNNFQRRNDASEEELRQQLQQVPEVGFGQDSAISIQQLLRMGLTRQNRSSPTAATLPPDLGFRFYQELAKRHRRPEVVSLPWQRGANCQTGKESAEWQQSCSVHLRACLLQSGNVSGPTTTANLKALMQSRTQPGQPPSPWTQPECVPTLVQMLQVENSSVRELLVETLAKIKGREATVALAKRAVFDLSPQVRKSAVEALQQRRRKDFQPILLAALRWPWQPAADHAAEAIVALDMKELAPDLTALLQDPDPALPYTKANGTFVRELVQLNHFQNCLLCHAPSTSSQDLARGLIPTPGQALAPAYYAASFGQFVRADTTFLRQDFSVIQPVASPGLWPAHQRFDYVLRERRANPHELKLVPKKPKENQANNSYPQREAVLFALSHLREVEVEVDAGGNAEQAAK
jgi:hypothetical protein